MGPGVDRVKLVATKSGETPAFGGGNARFRAISWPGGHFGPTNRAGASTRHEIAATDCDATARAPPRGREFVPQLCADATLGGSANIKRGLPSLLIVASSTTTRARLLCDGRSYITSSSTC